MINPNSRDYGMDGMDSVLRYNPNGIRGAVEVCCLNRRPLSRAYLNLAGSFLRRLMTV